MASRQRTIAVTGSSRGIGAAITQRLVEDGHTVIGICREPQALSIAEDLVGDYHPVPCDLNQIDQIKPLAQQLLSSWPQLDGLICCAGRGLFGALEQTSPEQVRSLFELNSISPIVLVQQLMPHFKTKQCGDIVLIGSEAALRGGREGAVYCASKFALRGFAEAMRAEGARRNVRVTLINPGMVRTPFFDDLHFGPGESSDNALLPSDIADFVKVVLDAPGHAVVDSIVLSPLKHVVRRRDTRKG